MEVILATIETRRNQDGTKSYRAKIRFKNLPVESATFARLTDAKRWAQSTEASMHEGRYFKSSESKKHSLADLIEKYISEVLPSKPKNAVNTIRNLLWWKDNLGSYRLSDITPAMIAQQRDKLLNSNTMRNTKRSPSTVIRYLAALSHAYTVAMNEWGWVDDSPLRKVTKPSTPRGRVRYLSDTEREALLKVCKASKSNYLYIIVVLAISTGMRHGEILNLCWDQVDFSRGKITLHDTKNGESRSVPLVGHALAILKALSKIQRIDTKLLFPGLNPKKPVDTRKPWYTALKKAEIDNFRFHDLRHCTASYLAMNGASLAEIAEVLGHKTLSMVKRYTHIADSHTSKVVEKMNSVIFGDGLNLNEA